MFCTPCLLGPSIASSTGLLAFLNKNKIISIIGLIVVIVSSIILFKRFLKINKQKKLLN